MSKVVITGIGLVSAFGNCRECFWTGMSRDAAPFHAITRFAIDPMDQLYAAEVSNFDTPIPVKQTQLWTSTRSIQFAVGAVERALEDAGIVLDDSNRSEIGVVFGSTQSCLDIAVKLDVDSITRGPRTVNPMLFPHANPSAPSCRVSLHFGLKAFNAILSNGSTSGLDAIHYAVTAIRDGLAPVVLTGGVEELTRMTFLFHHAMEDLTPGGVVLGEGCGALVLEDERHARDRGANILAEVAGYGSSFWPDDASRAEAAEFAMRNALNSANLAPEEIDVVFASANGAVEGDRMEQRALDRILTGAVVVRPKARLGETHSAAGTLHSAACVEAMNRGALPVSPATPFTLRAGLINCFSTSLGTQINSSLVLRSYPS